MCISAKLANFMGTNILVHQTNHPRFGAIEVCGYQNIAMNNFGGPNALILHFPALEMTQANFIDSTGCRGIFGDLKRATIPEPSIRRGPPLLCSLSTGPSVEVFDHGIYTVVLAKNARDIPKALERVPSAKRPDISGELCEFYATYRHGWPIALCCFDNKQAQKAQPIFVWYKPMNWNVLIAPGIDCHTGAVPDMQAKVHVDHRLFFAVQGMRNGRKVNYSDHVTREQMRDFLPEFAVGVELNDQRINGDFVVKHSEILEGRPVIRRVGTKDPANNSSAVV
jgi:hypothetical protein